MERVNKKNFNIESKAKKGVAVWCNTEESANNFINFLSDNGYKWGNGILERMTNWGKYKENTCYILELSAESLDSKSCIYIQSIDWIYNNNSNAQFLPGMKKYQIYKWE